MLRENRIKSLVNNELKRKDEDGNGNGLVHSIILPMHEVTKKITKSTIRIAFLVWFTLLPCKWRLQVPLKCW